MTVIDGIEPSDATIRPIGFHSRFNRAEAKIPSGSALLLDLASNPERTVLVLAHHGRLEPKFAIVLRTVASLVNSNTVSVVSLRYNADVSVSMGGNDATRAQVAATLPALAQTQALSLNKLAGKASSLQKMTDQSAMWLLYPGATDERFAMWNVLQNAPINATRPMCACEDTNGTPQQGVESGIDFGASKLCECRDITEGLLRDASQLWARVFRASEPSQHQDIHTIAPGALSLSLLRRLAVLAPVPSSVMIPVQQVHSPDADSIETETAASSSELGTPRNVASRLVAASLSAEGRLAELGAFELGVGRAKKLTGFTQRSAVTLWEAPVLWRHSGTHGSSLLHRHSPLEQVSARYLLRQIERGVTANSQAENSPVNDDQAQRDGHRLLHGLGASSSSHGSVHWFALCASRDHPDASDAWSAMNLVASATHDAAHDIRIVWLDAALGARRFRGRTGVTHDKASMNRQSEEDDNSKRKNNGDANDGYGGDGGSWMGWLFGAGADPSSRLGATTLKPSSTPPRTDAKGVPITPRVRLTEAEALAILGCGSSVDAPVVRYFGPAERHIIAPLEHEAVPTHNAAPMGPSSGDDSMLSRLRQSVSLSLTKTPYDRVLMGLKPVEMDAPDVMRVVSRLSSGARGVTLHAVTARLAQAVKAVSERVTEAAARAASSATVSPTPRFKGQQEPGSSIQQVAVTDEPGEGEALSPSGSNANGNHDATRGLEWLDGVRDLTAHESVSEGWSDFRVSQSELRPEAPAPVMHALVSELWEAAVALGGAGVVSQSSFAGRLSLLDALGASFSLLPPKQMRARIAVVQAAIRGTGVTGAQASLEAELLSDREVKSEAQAHAARVKNKRHRLAQEAKMHKRDHDPTSSDSDEEDQVDIHSDLASGHAQEALAMTMAVLRARRKHQGATKHSDKSRASSSSMKLHGPREQRLAEQYAEYMDASFRSGKAAEWLDNELQRVIKRLQQVSEHGGRANLLDSGANHALGRTARESVRRNKPFVPVHARPPSHGGAAQAMLTTELQQRKNILESLTSDDRRKQLAEWELLEKRRDAALAANGLVPFSEDDRQHADAVRKYGSKGINTAPQDSTQAISKRDEL